MSVVFHNSEFIKEDALVISHSNRALNYGDGFFETIKIINAKPFNFSAHYIRYCFACTVLKLKHKQNEQSLLRILKELITYNNIVNGSVKLHITRSGNGKYLPESISFDILITSSDGAGFKLNPKISLCVFYDEVKTKGKISNIKSINAIVSVLGAIYAKESGFENAILMNTEGNCIETTNSNIFIVKDEIIYTPPITDGCVNGTMRKWVVQNINVLERSIDLIDIRSANEVFITNAISGVTSVETIESKSIGHFNTANYLQNKLISSNLDL
ncbi:aminotransferase class IV [Flavobacteriales bacterium]|nr:aminotransferase class IV [Flavobacteriales bacterium]